ncbi:hypothetical protein HYQ46_006627 [Verticillium longisporum]|nr:hypothetical protein HYQ46_006627 [Verticillium longisporum]
MPGRRGEAVAFSRQTPRRLGTWDRHLGRCTVEGGPSGSAAAAPKDASAMSVRLIEPYLRIEPGTTVQGYQLSPIAPSLPELVIWQVGRWFELLVHPVAKTKLVQ